MFIKELTLILVVSLTSCTADRSFVIDYANNQFLRDGEPFRYVSGGIHYFRVQPTEWNDRLYKVRKAGLNAIQTYVAWNIHEPYEGKYNFEGIADIVKFVTLAQAQGLLVILRPGPYICAEWEYGGFPYWIMKKCKQTIRTSDKTYMLLVDKWMSVLLTKLKPYLYENGGPIISVQVENEYGSFGCDHEYMNLMEAMYRKYLGDNVVLFTTDGDGDGFLKCGATESLYTTVDFGPGGDVKNAFSIQRKYQPHGPFVNSEYYAGWLDHWGEHHHTTSSNLVAQYLDKMLSLNASVNMYMFEGGTNFGFMNGANQGGTYQAQPTSYDYDAPLTEAGDPTDKYFAIQKVLSKYYKIPSGPQPVPSKKVAYGIVHVNQTFSLYEMLDKITPLNHSSPQSFEYLDINYGYILYRTLLPRTHMYNTQNVIKLGKYHDRATVIVDRVVQGILDMNYNNTIEINTGTILDIIVENQGRVNYGPYLKDTAKGILGNVTLNGMILGTWKMYPINTDTIEVLSKYTCRIEADISASQLASKGPVTATFGFHVDAIADTFLKLDQWTKGFVVLNGFNLGRYWTPLGPQKTLYVPKCRLKVGLNILHIYEFDVAPTSPSDIFIEFVDAPILG